MNNFYFVTPFVICILSCLCFMKQDFITSIADSFCKLVNNVFFNEQFPVSSKFSKSIKNTAHELLFTKDELSQYNGIDNSIYLSILGKVFDVSKGKKYYGPGNSYHGFAGRDASKSFITGDFSENGLTDDLSDLSSSDMNNLQEWLERYHKDYVYKGKLIGRFYDENGDATSYLKEIENKILKGNERNKQIESFNQRYPPCNIEWSQEKGSRVWCSNRSGGIKREWIGVPRKIFMPGWNDYRCACIKSVKEKLSEGGRLKQFKNCDPNSFSCYVGKDE